MISILSDSLDAQKIETARTLVGDLILVASETSTRPDRILGRQLRQELVKLTVTSEGWRGVTVVLEADKTPI
jgi:hypothetical protein